MFDTIVAFITITAAVAAYFISGHSMLITILVIVACAMISKAFRSIFQVKLESSFPPSNVYYIREDNLLNTENKGLRVVVITERIFFHTEVDLDKKFILDYIDENAQKLCAKNEIFKYRYNYVIKHNLPYQSTYAACRNAKSSLKVVYKKWFDSSGLNYFGLFKDNLDSFSIDDIIVDPRDKTEHRTMIQFIFDPNMPLPDENYKLD